MKLGSIWCPRDLSVAEKTMALEAPEWERDFLNTKPNFVLSIIMSISFRSEIVA